MKKAALWTSLAVLCLAGGAVSMAELSAFPLAAESKEESKSVSAASEANCTSAAKAATVSDPFHSDPQDCPDEAASAGMRMPDGTRILQDGTTILPKKAPLH